MENKKQTAVELLIWEMSKIGLIPDGVPDELYQQVIAMEKEQIIHANNMGYYAAKRDIDETAEKYYTSTYGQ